MSLWLPTPDQRDIADAISGAISETLPLDRLHGDKASDSHRLGDLAAVGILGIAIEEEAGGSGLGVVEEALVFEQLGYHLASPAVLASVLAAHASQDASALVSAETCATLASTSPDGSLLLFDLADNGPVVVLNRHEASLIERPADITPIEANAWGVAMSRSQPIKQAVVPSAGLGLRARLLIASQLSGMSRCALDMAVEYAKIREQFGKPIGSFQAVKHHAANMAVAALAARDLVAFAATALEQQRQDAAFQVEAALVSAIRAARDNAGTNIQIHGGIGFSDECDAHLVLKQSQVWAALAGGESAARTALLAEISPLSSTHSSNRS